MKTLAPFNRAPLYVDDGIPVFSRSNEYVDNYVKISSDHIASFLKNGTNPFIAEEIWKESEDSTALLLKKYTASGDKVLDVGVGMGRLLERFPELERHGMDISPGYLKMAMAHGISVCLSLIEDMPYRESFFDAVLCTDVLEHVLDLNLCVTKILSVLKPGGHILIRVPYRENLSPYTTPACPYRFVHLRNFDENSLWLLFSRIFPCEQLEQRAAVLCILHPALARLRVSRLTKRVLGVAKLIHRPLYCRLRHLLYLPLEINAVFRKPVPDPVRSL